jgi:preprotein translocase subunit YajC
MKKQKPGIIAQQRRRIKELEKQVADLKKGELYR